MPSVRHSIFKVTHSKYPNTHPTKSSFMICIRPQLRLWPRGSRASRPPPPPSRRVAPPAPGPVAARRRRRRAPPRRTLWPLHRWEGASRRAPRTRQEAAGEQSPERSRKRRARVSPHAPTRTPTTATTIRFSSRPRGSEVRDRGTLHSTFIFLNAGDYIFALV